MKISHIILATALLASGGAASAQAVNDARCIILSNGFLQQTKDPKDAAAQKAAEASLYFYLGRLGSQSPAQIKALMEAQAKTLNDTNAGPLMNDCVKELRSKVDMMQNLGGPAPAPAATQKKPEGR